MQQQTQVFLEQRNTLDSLEKEFAIPKELIALRERRCIETIIYICLCHLLLLLLEQVKSRPDCEHYVRAGRKHLKLPSAHQPSHQHKPSQQICWHLLADHNLLFHSCTRGREQGAGESSPTSIYQKGLKYWQARAFNTQGFMLLLVGFPGSLWAWQHSSAH